MTSLRKALLLMAALPLALPLSAQAAGWGNVTGQFVFDGEVPKQPVLVSKGDPTAKDSAVCAAETIVSKELVVDPDTKAIANVFIYLRSAPDIHPDLKSSAEKEVVFDQKGCEFKPHSLFIRTDQTVVVKSDDAVAHNTHTFPIRNQAVNFLLRPGDREGVPVMNPVSEILPIQVKCDIHPWMLAYWLILDHPYATITGNDGKFTIEKLPAGEHSFRVWQEKAGYLDRALKVTIKDGETVDLGAIRVPAAKFAK
mgnify:CR=1 FL=1